MPPDLSLEVAVIGLGAVELQGAIFLLLVGVEEVQGNALEDGLGLLQVLSLKRNNTGLSVVGEAITLLACVCTGKAA